MKSTRVRTVSQGFVRISLRLQAVLLGTGRAHHGSAALQTIYPIRLTPLLLLTHRSRPRRLVVVGFARDDRRPFSESFGRHDTHSSTCKVNLVPFLDLGFWPWNLASSHSSTDFQRRILPYCCDLQKRVEE